LYRDACHFDLRLADAQEFSRMMQPQRLVEVALAAALFDGHFACVKVNYELRIADA
jgi:hypothetical protein